MLSEYNVGKWMMGKLFYIGVNKCFFEEWYLCLELNDMKELVIVLLIV